MLQDVEMPRCDNRLLRQDISITPPMSSKQWEVLDRSKVNNFATRPLYSCRISVSDSSLLKIYQRIDRPPSLPFGCEQLVILFLVGFCWQRITNGFIAPHNYCLLTKLRQDTSPAMFYIDSIHILTVYFGNQTKCQTKDSS